MLEKDAPAPLPRRALQNCWRSIRSICLLYLLDCCLNHAACVSSFWLAWCAIEETLLDHTAPDSITFRPLPSKFEIREMKGLRVCLRTEKEFLFASELDWNATEYALRQTGAEVCYQHVSDCDLIVAEYECQPALVGQEGGVKRFRWADGQEWTASRGCVSKEVSASLSQKSPCRACVCY